MPFAKTLIDPTYDREWIAKEGQFVTHAQDLDEDGRWLFCADDLDAAMELIENYPELHLQAVTIPEAIKVVEQRCQDAFLAGFTVPSGPLQGKVLQCRDVEDRTNWLASQVAYSAAIAAGAGDIPNATFRTADNSTVTCTYAEGSEVLLAMQGWGAQIMADTWALKDAIRAATTKDDVDALLEA